MNRDQASDERKSHSIPPSTVSGHAEPNPIVAVLDLLGRRWALRIVWQLRDGDRQSFRALQEICGISSPNVLNARLKELRMAGIVDLKDGEGFGLTSSGLALLDALCPLSTWADEWAHNAIQRDIPNRSSAHRPEGD